MSKCYKQNILIVHNYYQIPGGEDTVVLNEKRLLEEHGHKVYLYTKHNNELKTASFLRKILLFFSCCYNLRTVKDIKRIIKNEHIDIVHVHNTLPLISPAVYYAAIKCKTPVVQTIHNFRFLCPSATFYRDGHICEDCLKKGLYCSLLHKCYRNSFIQTFVCVFNTWLHRHTGILKRVNFICLTEFNKNKFLQIKYVDPSKIFVKPNFTFEFEQAKGRKITNRYSKEFFLYIGRIEEIKGIRLLVEAFKRMPNINLKLAGTGSLMKDIEISNNIDLLGFKNRDELVELIINAKAIILPSLWYEGFPMVITEAFSLHKAIIVGDIGNNGVLIEDGINGLKFKFNDVDSLIKVIRNFSQELRNKIENNAYKDYLRCYSAFSNYLELKKIYDSIQYVEYGKEKIDV